MSKSVGNVIYPADVIKRYGADVFRLWVSSADFKGDVRVSQDILNQMSEVYRKIRNTSRFLLGNLYDFTPADKVPFGELVELDRWALGRLARLVERVTAAYEDYDFHLLYHAVHNFCTVDMSAIYLDIIKDRVYCLPAQSRERRMAQTVMYEVITALVRIIAPVLVFTAEEIWQYLPVDSHREPSVHLAAWPVLPGEYYDEALSAKWDRLLEVRGAVAKVLEALRRDDVIGQSLQAEVTLYARGDLYQLLEEKQDLMADILIVSQVELFPWEAELPAGVVALDDVPGLAVLAQRITGEKCERCWKYGEDVAAVGEHKALCCRCSGVLGAN